LNKNNDQNREKLSTAYDESGLICRTHVGGQALIEGIMMRGRYNWALAVRKPNGSIYVEEHNLASGKDKNSWMYKPVVRGCTSLVEALALGYKALGIAANHAFDEEEEEEIQAVSEMPEEEIQAVSDIQEEVIKVTVEMPEKEIKAVTETQEAEVEAAIEAVEEVAKKQAESSDSALPKAVMTGAMIVGLLLGIAIFIVVPAVITNLIVGDYAEDTLLWNIVDGILRVAIFIGYIFLIGRMSDIKRMFGYHGAEHRAIHCYERGKELTVVNAQRYPSLHVRCGTAFMLMTMIIAIFVFTIVPIQLLIGALGIQNEILRLIVVIICRILLLPLIAGLSYEFTVKWAGSHPDNPLVKVVLWPGLQLQRLTTNPPDDGMVECAIAAMNAVLAREELEAKRATRFREQKETEDTVTDQENTEAQKVAL